MGDSSDAERRGADYEGVRRTCRRDGAGDARTLEDRTRDADGSAETARHDGGGTTRRRRVEVTDPKRIRVGIIGANPDRGWAAQAHIPALKSLSHDFEITALSTSRRESADVAAQRFGVRLAFDNHDDLVNSDAVDVVAVTVRVPYHLGLATAARDAGRAVDGGRPPGT